MTPEQYQDYVQKKAPPSPILPNVCRAFVVGGLICTFGQGLMTLYTAGGMAHAAASTTVSLSLIVLSSVLTGFNLYSHIGRFGGGGSLVPITGFANAVTAAGLDFKSEGFITGLGSKLFAVAGPVIVYGTLASVVYGIVLQLLSQWG